MGNESSSEATGNLLRLRSVRRPVWTRPETKKPEFAHVMAKAEALVHRLDAKIDALHDSFVALVQDGKFTRKMLFRVARCLEAVEAQAETNKGQIDQVAEEMNQAEQDNKPERGEKDDKADDWTGTLEALNLAYALSKDADDVLADCTKLRDALYVEPDRPSAGFKKFRALDQDTEARSFVSALVQAWRQNVSTNSWEHALEPEPAETVEQFIERVLADAARGDVDVMEHAHDAYCAALEKALLQKDPGAWIDVRDLDRKFKRLVGRLDLSAGLSKIKSVVIAKQERQRAHFAALASGEAVPEQPAVIQGRQKELERAWTDLVFEDLHGSAPLRCQLKHILETTASMKLGLMSDPGPELARSELSRVAAHLARAATIVAEESSDFVVQLMTDELKLVQILFPGDDEPVDADLELALLAFVRELVDAREDNLRSHLVFAAYILQMITQRLDGAERLDGQISASLSLWMEAELLVAGGDRAAANMASAAKEQVDKELAEVERQAERQADEDMAATVQGLRDGLERLRATVDTLRTKTKIASPQAQALEAQALEPDAQAEKLIVQ
jgi:hypothetical protein